MFSLQSYFSKDNATAKLASTLILIASVLSTVAKLSFLPVWVQMSIPCLISVNTVAATFFQANKVIYRSSWYLLAYAIIDAVTTYTVAWPHAQELLVSLAAMLKVLAGFTTQQPDDPKPPAAILPPAPVKL